jgi:hypothetical protein
VRNASRFQPLPGVCERFDGFLDIVDKAIDPRGINSDEQFFLGSKVVINGTMQDAKGGRYVLA